METGVYSARLVPFLPLLPFFALRRPMPTVAVLYTLPDLDTITSSTCDGQGLFDRLAPTGSQ